MLQEKQDRDAIVSSAMGIASEEERDAYIAQACGDDDDLRRQVEERVAAHLQGGGKDEPARSYEDDTPDLEQATASNTEGREPPPSRIGPYKLLKPVGEGIAGVVFQAEQQEPVRLMVALKLIKEGLDWRQILARFEAERDALTLLEHPNTAKLLGAGTRQSGQPYFVREWVEGVPITKYCDDHQLSPKQRLELFVPVCQAVQYAHQKGILHGDLKPSNVLVAGQGGKEGSAVPKILDFGMAEALRRRPGEGTSAAVFPGGKPEYLSPEQADANVQDMDSRSDVYGLGVLLYELLTGTTPLPRERLKDVPGAEAARLVREEEIPPPSKRLSESKDGLASVSAQRKTKPEALVNEVRGPLDCLVMKALEKDRARRYATANDLARDIQRYLAHEPMEACPTDAKSRFWQTAHEHPRALAGMAVLLVLLLIAGLGGVGLAAWSWHKEGQAQKAEQEAVKKQEKADKAADEAKGKLQQTEAARKATAKERDQAQQAEKAARSAEDDAKAVLAFVKDRLLSANRPTDVSISEAFWTGGQGKDVTLRKAVDKAEPQVAQAFADRPLAEASIREMLGLAYLNLGEPALAVKQYQRALDLSEAMLGVNHPDSAECRNKLAVAYRLANRAAEAGQLFNQNVKSPAYASALAARGAVLLSEKKPSEAELKLRAALSIRQKIQPDDWTTFEAKSLLGEALLEQKKYIDAEPLLLSGYQGLKEREAKIPSPEKVHLKEALKRLVRLYETWDKPDKAAQWRKELEATKPAPKS
jgi:serine/threonine protein kinase